MKKYLSVIFCALCAYGFCHAKNVNVKDFGALPNDDVVDTAQIQKAIDECSATGGGDVVVPCGLYLTSQISLKDGVTLVLEQNAVLKMSDKKDKPSVALVAIQSVKNAGIRGLGVLDGNGKSFEQSDNAKNRPYVVYVNAGKNIHISDITMTNSAVWTCRLFRSDGVWIKGVKIYSHTNFNNDGIDIDAKNVVVSDCKIDCDDDAICLKSDDPKFLVENVVITNCIVASNCNPIKFGTSNHCGFKNVTISNCVIVPCAESNYRNWSKANWMKPFGVAKDITGLSGIALEAVDGGYIENVSISNIVMTDVQTPLLIRAGRRNRDNRQSYVKNIVISNIVATSQSWISSSITGLAKGRVENVVVRDCVFNLLGGEPVEYASIQVPEKEKSYPENRMFGVSLPSYGMYLRHADNITISNVQFLTHTNLPSRPPVVAEDVSYLRLLDCLWRGAPILKDCSNSKERGNITLK